MDVATKIHAKLEKILKKLKNLGIVQTFKLEIIFSQVEGSLRKSLIEIDSVLKKCLRKIISKPRKAEIRNIISELVRKKNLSNIVIVKESVQGDLLNKNSLFIKQNSDIATVALKFQCGFCEEIFNSKKSLMIHNRMHKCSGKYLCNKCGKLFQSVQKLQEHIKEYYDNIMLPFTLKHVTSNLKNEMLIFDNCNLNVLSESQMQTNITSRNLLIQTVGERELKMPIQEINLEKCMTDKAEKKFICSCGKVFQILNTLKKHERIKHSIKSVKYDCLICGQSFIEKAKLNRHMLSHKDSQYSCSFCSKHFSRSDTLKHHMTLFHYVPKEFACSYCPKKFKLKYNRDTHEENIHKNVNNKVPCRHCGRKFKNKITLKSHMKHHSEKKIMCDVCCKSFTRKSYYKSHIKSKHFGIIPCQKILESVSL